MPDAFRRLCRAAILLLLPLGPAAAEPGWFIPGRPGEEPAAGRPLPVPPVANPQPGASSRSDVLDAFMPFYRIGPSSLRHPEAMVVDIEATMRPTYTNTMPLFHQEIPLPPGNWTVVSVNPEASRDPGPASGGSLAARLDGHRVTGLILIRGSDPGTPGTLAQLPPNRFCESAGHYAAERLAGPADGRDACWFVAEAMAPALFWTLPEAPPELLVGIETMRRTGEQVPARMLGVTYFRIQGPRWIEVTTYFDTARNGVADDPAGRRLGAAQAPADPAMHGLVDRLGAWTTRRLPLLQAPGDVRTPADAVAASNVGVPEQSPSSALRAPARRAGTPCSAWATAARSAGACACCLPGSSPAPRCGTACRGRVASARR